MNTEKEKNYTIKETAEKIGIPVEELLVIAYENGLINEDGTPTQFALDEGLLVVEEEING